MGRREIGFGILGLAVVLLTACAQGHCRRKSPDGEASVAQTPASASEVPEIAPKPSPEDHIFVYKYDGSLQCGMGKPVALDAMAKQLKGITIFSRAKKRDGLMHIQVCGSVTGMANVYEIPTAQQKKAEAAGFKKWSFE